MTRVTFAGGDRASGSVSVPGSKSQAIRALLLAGFTPGRSVISGFPLCDDIRATVRALRLLGAGITEDANRLTVTGISATERGEVTLPVGESATLLRLLIPLLMLSPEKAELLLSGRLPERGLEVYETLFRSLDLPFSREGERVNLSGGLKPGTYTIPGGRSSQYASGLLLALSLLDGESRLELLPPVVSRPYLDLTIDALARFGVKIKQKGTSFSIPAIRPKAAEISVEGDASSAAFPAALNLLGGSVEVLGVPDVTKQGDAVFRRIYPLLDSGTPTVDLSDCPDLGPVLFALAAAKHGARFTGVSRLRDKESDRADAMREELAAFGGEVRIDGDTATVLPIGKLYAPTRPLRGHCDHRVVMALSVLLSVTGGVLLGAEAVGKSYPGFFEMLSSLGIRADLADD